MKQQLLALIVITLAIADGVGAIVSVQLKQITSRRQQLIQTNQWAEHVAQKQTNAVISQSNMKMVVMQPVRDYDDTEFVGEICIGTPPQLFSVIIDTGSADLWILANNYQSESAMDQQQKTFAADASATFSPTNTNWSILYGDGLFAQGVIGVDNVAIGMAPYQILIQQQSFGLAQLIGGFMHSSANGVLGLAFSSLSRLDVATPVANAMAQQLLLNDIVAIYMRHKGATSNQPDGLITYGGYDTNNCGDTMGKVQMTSETFWQYRLYSIGAGNYVNLVPSDAITDTASSFISGPPAAIYGLAKALGAKWNYITNHYEILCAMKMDAINLVIDSSKLKIDSDNLIERIGNSSTCNLALSAQTWGGWAPSWVFGTAFGRQYCQTLLISEQQMLFQEHIRPP